MSCIYVLSSIYGLCRPSTRARNSTQNQRKELSYYFPGLREDHTCCLIAPCSISVPLRQLERLIKVRNLPWPFAMKVSAPPACSNTAQPHPASLTPSCLPHSILSLSMNCYSRIIFQGWQELTSVCWRTVTVGKGSMGKELQVRQNPARGTSTFSYSQWELTC